MPSRPTTRRRAPAPAATPTPPLPVVPDAPPAALLRRVPQQDRGQRRVDIILDAAAEVIAEVGVDGATTNAIAARAHTSVGSLYQFFPNKDAIVQALAVRYTSAFEQLKDRVMALEVADLPLHEMMQGIVQPIAAYCDANPTYRHVYAATNDAVRGPSAEEARLHEAVVSRIEALIARRCPWVPAAQRHATAVVQVETVHAILFHVQLRPPEERPALREELVRMLVCALEPFDRMRPAGWPEGRAG
ncbi:regulatory protein TetR (plasmid) [Gemmatirosa kalamazoonensis]|uniref:Regulatory protein TetR n=1 Tax=Gemmatirosa kalamazoonensis TaxID=861299 RepID=W0RUQ1_9BACT|nr:TetR/AcrR family transcriptional regulator [Gemmatirosa kalamazoonensis]AHG93308.1 regulatory protein TetR [Gemmatirosa kalamazoonensis]